MQIFLFGLGHFGESFEQSETNLFLNVALRSLFTQLCRLCTYHFRTTFYENMQRTLKPPCHIAGTENGRFDIRCPGNHSANEAR